MNLKTREIVGISMFFGGVLLFIFYLRIMASPTFALDQISSDFFRTFGTVNGFLVVMSGLALATRGQPGENMSLFTASALCISFASTATYFFGQGQ